MSHDIKFRWGDLHSRLLNQTEPNDWAILPNNKERRIFELLTTVLQRFPMQKEWPPEHRDLKPDDWHRIRRGFSLLLMTDVEFEKIVRVLKIEENMMARALTRYLALKRDAEHAANQAWLLNEEAVRRWMIKKKIRFERQQILETIAALDERDRMDNRYHKRIKNEEKIHIGREQDYEEARTTANERQRLINQKMREASESVQEHALKMIEHDREFRAETRHSRHDDDKQELSKHWEKIRTIHEHNEWIRKTLPDRENADQQRLATREWRDEMREKEAREASNWLDNARLKTDAEHKQMRRLIAAEALEAELRRDIAANRSTSQLTGALDAMDESTRVRAPNQSEILSQSTGRATYTRSSK